jgi:hypothetical protein
MGIDEHVDLAGYVGIVGARGEAGFDHRLARRRKRSRAMGILRVRGGCFGVSAFRFYARIGVDPPIALK